MSLINKGSSGSITIDAILTAAGREALANGTFVIDNFKLGDDEVDYSLASSVIEGLPVFECFYDSSSNLRSTLIKDSNYYTINSNLKNWSNTDGGCGVHAYMTTSGGGFSQTISTTFDVVLEVLNNGPYNDWSVNGVSMTSSKMVLSPVTPNQTFMIRSSVNNSNRQLRVTISSITHESTSVTHVLTANAAYSTSGDTKNQ